VASGGRSRGWLPGVAPGGYSKGVLPGVTTCRALGGNLVESSGGPSRESSGAKCPTLVRQLSRI